MKFRNQFLKYKLNYHQSPDAGDGGGGDAGAGDAGAGNAGDNNGDANLISHDTMWDTDNTPAGNADGNQQQGQQQQQQQAAPTANEQFDTHIAGLDFMGGIDMNGAAAAFQSGDMEAVGKMFQQIGANAYRNAMIDTNRVVNQRVETMGSQVTNDMNAQNATGRVVGEMNAALPFTAMPAFAPMAKVVLTKFMEKGGKPEDAIKEVGKYFNNLSGEVGKMNPGAPHGRPSSQFGGNGMQQIDDGNNAEEPDWMTILGGPTS